MFFRAIGATKGEEVVRLMTEAGQECGGGQGIEAAGGGAAEKRRVGAVDFLPKATEGGVGIKGGGREAFQASRVA